VYTLIDRRGHPGGWLAKFKCEIREIREISPPASAGLPNKMSAKSAISAKSPPSHSRHADALRVGRYAREFQRGEFRWAERYLAYAWNRSHMWTSSADLGGWACPSYCQAADKRDSDRGWLVSRLSASVFIWPGMASGRRPVVQFSPSCQKLPNQENVLGAPC
jgi:hypothetical protein